DLMLLIPYFTVLVILASYGIHRYQLVWMYYKNRKNKVTEPPAEFQTENLPRVTIQLPIYNEQFVIDRLVDAVCKIRYPKDKLDIQVLDDSTDETVQVASAVVDRYAAMGNPVSYHHRNYRKGFNAGELDEGLKYEKGERVAIFDADFVPFDDWLIRVVHQFTDHMVGME